MRVYFLLTSRICYHFFFSAYLHAVVNIEGGSRGCAWRGRGERGSGRERGPCKGEVKGDRGRYMVEVAEGGKRLQGRRVARGRVTRRAKERH